MASFISKLIGHNSKSETQPSIALPTNDAQSMNMENVSNDLERLPIGWNVLSDTSVSQEDQKKHPSEAINAIQSYTSEIQDPTLRKPINRVSITLNNLKMKNKKIYTNRSQNRRKKS
jgi:hypothetical protein